MFAITKFPVVILSSPRTGSTALTLDIWNQLKKIDQDMGLFVEPTNAGDRENLITAIDNKKPYVLKIHAGDVWRYPIKIQNSINNNDCFLVRIRRKNLIDQVASLYIARSRNIWSYSSTTAYGQTIDIDREQIKKTIKITNRFNTTLDNYSVTFDLNLYYEDLDFFNNYVLKTPQPDNYDLLCKTIEEILT
jgi:LPS sulfotransferase NodH